MPQKPASRAIPNHRLRQARLERGWSQAEVADKLSDQTKELYVHTSQVSRWESGVLRPGTFYQQKLSQLFGKAREELGIVAEPPAGLSMFLLDPIIPQRLRPIIGREQLLRSLKRRLCLKEPMFFTALSGLPGVGKTALAVELAHDPEIHQYFPDGVLWADVGPHPSRREVQSRWARLLGLRATETRAWRTDEDWAMAIRHAIGVRRMLLVIDDVWGIEDALALELGGPFCAHLLTSRSSIIATHLGNEQVVRVPSLKEEDGVRLLAQFAPQVIEAEPEEVRSLVHEVGGLPLALRLIGGYLSAQTYHKQARRIREALRNMHCAQARLRLAQPQVGLQRHPSLPAGAAISLDSVIGLSYEAESMHETTRLALQALSVFPAQPQTFTEEAAVTVAAITAETLDELVDSGLVEVSEQGRYTLHQTIADYLRLKVCDPTASKRMLSYFTAYVEKHQYDYNLLEPETSNILTALEKAFQLEAPADLVRGANAFADFLLAQGLYEVAEVHLDRARQVAHVLDEASSFVTTLLNLGRIVERRGDYFRAQGYLQEGIFLAHKMAAPACLCDFLAELGEVYNHTGDYQQAEDALQEALALARQGGERERICFILKNLGVVASEKQGNYACAQGYLREGLALAREIDSPGRIVGLLQSLGVVAAYQGEYEKAEGNWQESLALARQIEERASISTQLLNLGALADLRGEDEKAGKYWEESLALAQQIGLRENIAYLLLNLGEATLHREDYRQAEAYFQEGVDLARQMRHDRLLCLLLRDLGEAALHHEAYQQAETYLHESLDLAHRMKQSQEMSATLCIWGQLCFQQLQLEQAIKTFNEALSIAPEGSQEWRATAYYGLAQVAAAQGKRKEACRRGQDALEVFEKLGHRKAAIVRQWLWEQAIRKESHRKTVDP